MTWTGYGSYEEVTAGLSDLTVKFLEMTTKLGYSEPDARTRALADCRMIINSPLMITNILAKGVNRQVDFPALVGLADGTTQTAGNALDQWTRASLTALYQFKVETLWKNLLRALGMANPPDGHYRILQELFPRVSVPDQAMKSNILQVTAHIRNSLHSNGFHYGYRNSSSHITVDGFEFCFDHGTRVECAGWWHIVKAINGSANVIEEVLDTPEISGSADPIPDDYPPLP